MNFISQLFHFLFFILVFVVPFRPISFMLQKFFSFRIIHFFELFVFSTELDLIRLLFLLEARMVFNDQTFFFPLEPVDLFNQPSFNFRKLLDFSVSGLFYHLSGLHFEG